MLSRDGPKKGTITKFNCARAAWKDALDTAFLYSVKMGSAHSHAVRDAKSAMKTHGKFVERTNTKVGIIAPYAGRQALRLPSRFFIF